MRLRKLLVVFATLAVLLTVPVAQALAYGHADQPLAQIEFSANCNNPSFWFCSDVVGTGGIWLWIEIDANGTGDLSGAGCGHVVGGIGGPGGAGGGSIKGDVTWTIASANNLPPEAFPVTLFGPAYSGDFYVVTIPDGEEFAFPTQPGHYAAKPAPGVTIQTQVAP